MKCYICNKEIVGEQFNPFPLYKISSEKQCCKKCFEKYVIDLSFLGGFDLFTNQSDLNFFYNIKVGDVFAIFYSSISNIPLKYIKKYNRVLYGIVLEIDLEYYRLFGTWGKFPIELTKDNYCKIL